MTKVLIRYRDPLGTESEQLDSGARVIMEAPKEIGGKGGAFSPTDMIGTSLASCMLVMMGRLAAKLKISLEGATADVEKEMAQTTPRRIAKLTIHFRFRVTPPAEVQKQLEKEAMNCPVHFSLHPDVQQEIQFFWG
ncbi:MAG: OsmC family protein [Verrucomicrobiota bacterium]|nr:OsmC family protein [Verrucomicrobiota bacterium]